MKNHQQIAQLWADRTMTGTVMGDRPVPDALKGHHMFYERETIYSYGYHFPIARFYDDKTVFFNADGYSTSTAKHKSIVRRTLRQRRPDVTMFTMPSALWGQDNHALSVLFYMDKIQRAVKKWQRATKYKNIWMRDAADYLQEFKNYCAFHKLKPTRIIESDGSFAAACAVIALNPVPATDY